MASQQSASQAAPKRPSRREAAWRTVATVGIDIGKWGVHIVGMDAAGSVVVQEKAAKVALPEELVDRGPFVIGMEACSWAHFLGRQLREQGHDVRLMPPKYVQPHVKRDKTDWNDAER